MPIVEAGEAEVGAVALRWSTRHNADTLLEQLVGSAPRGQLCPRCGSAEHGPRWVTGWIGVSVAYAAPLTLVAVGQVALGVDVEPETATGPGDVHLGVGDHGDPLDLWVIKEAVLKAAGVGLSIDPREVAVELLPSSAHAHARLRDAEFELSRLAIPHHRAWLAVAAAR